MSSRTDRTRTAILKAAWQRLSVPGDPARLEDIAADAGVTRQSVYLHFGSRGALLIALVDYMDRELGLVDRLAAIAEITDPVEALRESMRLMARYQPQIHGVSMALLRLAPTDADAAAVFEDRMQRRRAGAVELLRAVKRGGRLVPGWSVRQVADVLWELGAPSSYQHLVVERGWTVKEFERWLLHATDGFIR